jgi:uncharacterized membrane protein YkvA (DUF1232 family)
MDPAVLHALTSIAVGILAVWVLLVVALLAAMPGRVALREALRLLPDLLRLLPRLARDRAVPRSVRGWLWVTLGYLAFPVDLVPDFIPVLGYADDAVVVAAVLRLVVRRAGADAVQRHWPGTPDGLEALLRVTGTGRARAPHGT